MRLTLLSAVTLLVVLAGCTGGTPGVGDGTPTPGPATDGGASGNTDCRGGESFRWVDPSTGERVSLEVEGTATHEGRQVCKAVWETNDPDTEYSRVVMYYAEDDSYQKIVYYDAQGNVVNEIAAQDPGSNRTPDGDEATRDGAAGDWCVEGRTVSFADPQAGRSASMEVQGIVEHEGREVCKSVYETNDPDTEYSRVEMYYAEDDSYQKVVYYDAQGNVVNEFELSGTVTAAGG